MKHVWQIFLFLTVLVSCLTGCGRRQAMEIEEETFPAVSSFEEESQEETEVSRGTLFVDVRGAVAKPGVYELPEKSRVFQAVEAAGGLLPEALERLVNQAAELTDGQQVYIPFEGEETEGGQAPLQETDDRVNINTAGPEELKHSSWDRRSEGGGYHCLSRGEGRLFFHRGDHAGQRDQRCHVSEDQG